ncbi:MAG: hypothetical protein AB8I56_12135, partial [Anaerolineales bacterium]
ERRTANLVTAVENLPTILVGSARPATALLPGPERNSTMEQQELRIVKLVTAGESLLTTLMGNVHNATQLHPGVGLLSTIPSQ